MIHRRIFAWLLMLALLLPLLAACRGDTSASSEAEASPAGGTGTEIDYAALIGAEPTVENAPPVANAEQASQHGGKDVQLTYYGDPPGIGRDLDLALAQKFTEATGIEIEVVPKPESATQNYSVYQRFLQAESPEIDVMMIDVIWPGALAPHLVDLNEKLSQEAQQHYEGIIENNTVDGRLVAMPWYSTFGMLYYRTDLLEKYGFDAPPETWDELEEQAQTIMEGEREEGNSEFVGFVFQGNAYEGLTCDALEWVASSGGGTFIENGKVTINNPQAIEILNKARGWVGTIAPQDVTRYQEAESLSVFIAGNAAFLRNWPYVYTLGNAKDSPIAGKFDVAPLPAAGGQKHVGTIGGWQLGVSKYSQHQDAAIEFVRYLASPEVQTYRAVIGSYIPTIPSVAQSPAVMQAMPFLDKFTDVERVARPSAVLRTHYNEGSTAIFLGMNRILNGADAAQVVPEIENQLRQLLHTKD